MLPPGVHERGVDSSGRAVLASDYLWHVWEAVVDDLGFRPTITQGAWMSLVPGGGASDSAGYHDQGGCIDLRVWDRTSTERRQMVRVLRQHGCAAWRRYKVQGFSEDHLHFVCGTDADLTPGAASQWRAYLDGRDGLASNGADYEWRPDPLVLQPPEDIVKPEDIKAIADYILDEETVTLRKADGTEREIPVRNALERILNPDDQ